jgi:hypothetical protein
MRRLPFARLSRRKITRALVAAVGLAIVLTFAAIGLCWFFGIHSRMDIVAYQAMIHEDYPPIWKDLAWRRIRKGDRLEDLIEEYEPVWREDFGPYVHVSYTTPYDFNWLGITAKDGRLICAYAGSCTWQHVFFDSPEEEEAFNKAYLAYAKQRMLESQAFKIHQVIKSGQDVFLARATDSRGTEYASESLWELETIYGRDYVKQMGLRPRELTVEVTTVLHGDLQVGAVLTFAGDSCDLAEAGEPEPVFLHVDDERLIDPQYPARELYVTVPRKALDWYQSLTPDQVKDLEARCLGERAKRPEVVPARE